MKHFYFHIVLVLMLSISLDGHSSNEAKSEKSKQGWSEAYGIVSEPNTSVC